MANGNNGNQFREDEIIILEQLRDGKLVKNIFPKIGGRLRLAHEANEQLSITTEIIKYDENLAVVKAVTSTIKGNFPGFGMSSIERDHPIAEWIGETGLSGFLGCEVKELDCRKAQFDKWYSTGRSCSRWMCLEASMISIPMILSPSPRSKTTSSETLLLMTSCFLSSNRIYKRSDLSSYKTCILSFLSSRRMSSGNQSKSLEVFLSPIGSVEETLECPRG